MKVTHSYEVVNKVNRLATKSEKYYCLPTKREKNHRPPGLEKFDRLPTWTDIMYICFQKEEHFVFFIALEVNTLIFDSSDDTCTLLQPISKSQKLYLEGTTDFICFKGTLSLIVRVNVVLNI